MTRALLVLLLLAVNCKSADYRIIEDRSARLAVESEKLISQDKYGEAGYILTFLKQLYPEDKKIDQLVGQLDDLSKKIVKPEGTLTGYNSRARYRKKSSVWRKILFYIPNRFMDFLDIASVRVNVGPQLGVSVWYTRAAQISLYAGNTAGLSIYPGQQKNIGFHREKGVELAFGPAGFGYYNISAERRGVSGVHIGEGQQRYNNPYDNRFQNYNDYWSLGLKVGFIYVGAELEIHLLEILDFFLGFLFIDLLGDDMDSSNKYYFTRYQQKVLRDLQIEMRRAGKEGLDNYRKQTGGILE